MQKPELSEELIRNFHIFWGNYPFPVVLVYKDRTILDINKAAAAVSCQTGTRCVDTGKKEDHAGCLANQALKEQTAKRVVAYAENMGMVVDGYWVPLAGVEDIYLHFFSDISEWAADRMFPNKENAEPNKEAGCSSCNCA
jgi:hypothetical protein